MAQGKMKSIHGIYKKHGRTDFLDAAAYYSDHVHPDSVDKTIDEMESRWYDSSHQQTEAEKMVQDYNDGLTILNDPSLAYVEKLSALKLYLDQKQMQVEDELTKALDALYCKNVPAGVRDYFNLRSGTPEPVQPKVKKPRAEKAAPAIVEGHENEQH